MLVALENDDFQVRFQAGKTGNGNIWIDFTERFGSRIRISMDEEQWESFREIIDKLEYGDITPNHVLPFYQHKEEEDE